ncbi:MAG: hypothetical protein MK212_05795 [Saprospiraceae bacterium]|nr:hypothetical protein [Saprospiraceae bacterium]
MLFRDYLHEVEMRLSYILPENILFWHLWCLTYPYERITNKKYKYYPAIRKYMQFLWQMNDKDTLDLELFHTAPFIQKIMSFDEDDYEDLDPFDISEMATRIVVLGLMTITSNYQKHHTITYLKTHEYSIDLIDIIIDQISISTEETNPIFRTEVDAQLQLLDKLCEQPMHYKYKDRNIFRVV